MLGQPEHDDQRQCGERRGDQEDRLDAVDDVGAQCVRGPLRRVRAGLRGEDGAEGPAIGKRL